MRSELEATDDTEMPRRVKRVKERNVFFFLTPSLAALICSALQRMLRLTLYGQISSRPNVLAFRHDKVVCSKMGLLALVASCQEIMWELAMQLAL